MWQLVRASSVEYDLTRATDMKKPKNCMGREVESPLAQSAGKCLTVRKQYVQVLNNIVTGNWKVGYTGRERQTLKVGYVVLSTPTWSWSCEL